MRRSQGNNTQILARHDRKVGKLLRVGLPPLESIPFGLVVDLGECKIGSELICMWTLFNRDSGNWC